MSYPFIAKSYTVSFGINLGLTLRAKKRLGLESDALNVIKALNDSSYVWHWKDKRVLLDCINFLNYLFSHVGRETNEEAPARWQMFCGEKVSVVNYKLTHGVLEVKNV